jgi:NAD(P)H-flavin reductase
MIADVSIVASLTYATREVEVEVEKIKEEEQHVVQEEHDADKAAKIGQSAAVRQRSKNVSNKRKTSKISNNHQKEQHFHIQQPAGKK